MFHHISECIHQSYFLSVYRFLFDSLRSGQRLLSYRAYFGYTSQKCEWKALSVLLMLSHLVVLHHAWIVYFVYQEGMRNDFPREYGRSASGRQASAGEHLTASADRSPQDSLSVIDMSGNEQSLLSILPFNCMKCVCRDNEVLRTLCLFLTCWCISSTL